MNILCTIRHIWPGCNTIYRYAAPNVPLFVVIAMKMVSPLYGFRYSRHVSNNLMNFLKFRRQDVGPPRFIKMSSQGPNMGRLLGSMVQKCPFRDKILIEEYPFRDKICLEYECQHIFGTLV